MRYPDRRVRFEAAMAIAAALPQRAFGGQDNVVPILAEVLMQTGKPGVLVLASSQDELNQRLEMIGKSGKYLVKGGISADTTVASATGLPGVDVIIANEKNADQIDRLLSQTRGNARLERAALLVIVASKVASPYASIAINDPLVTVTEAKDEAGFEAAIEEARKRSGGLPMDEKKATEYALRSAALLERLAISRGQVLDLSLAQNALLAAVDDTRPEVVKAAGQVLALMSLKACQQKLAINGTDEKTADDVKVSLLKSLAVSARFFGNQLDASQLDPLTKLVEAGATKEVREAAAEAHGADAADGAGKDADSESDQETGLSVFRIALDLKRKRHARPEFGAGADASASDCTRDTTYAWPKPDPSP